MECLVLSPAPQGRRVCLYAVPDGVPLYLKHNELMQQPGYRVLWRGDPTTISEQEATRFVMQMHMGAPPFSYRNYRHADQEQPSFQTAKESFHSAVEQLGKLLEYAPGSYPTEVLVGESAP